MKTLKLKTEEKSKVSREIISKIGETIYHNPEVEGVHLSVCFKDGSIIAFRRDEEEDEIGRKRGGGE